MSDTNSQAQSHETATRHRRTQAEMSAARGEPSLSDTTLARIIEITEQRIASRPNPMSLDTFEQIEAFAVHAARTQMVPKDYQGKPDNIILAVMQGKELGLPPIQAIQSIAMVNGRPSVWGDAVPGLCYARGLVEDHEEHFEGAEGQDDFTAVCTVKRKGVGSVKTARFSQADAKKAGLYGQAVHGKYPRRMMQWRARHSAFHDAFPDVLRGIGTREIEAEDAVATPGWTMPTPEKGWFTSKPQARQDGWDDTWFSGVVQKLADEPNAWKWLDLLVACLTDAPTMRDVDEIGDLPVVVKVLESAPAEGKQAIEAGFAAARSRLAGKPKEPEKSTPNAAAPDPETPPMKPVPPAFSAWLVDGDGKPIPDGDGVVEAFTDPVAFAEAYMAAKDTMFPGDVELFRRANHDSLAAAQIVSTKVAPILAGKATPQPRHEVPDGGLFGDLPVDPPATEGTAPHPTAPQNNEELAAAMIEDVRSFDKSELVATWQAYHRTLADLATLKAGALPLYAEVVAAADKHKAALLADEMIARFGQCVTAKDVAAIGNDLAFVSDAKWLHSIEAALWGKVKKAGEKRKAELTPAA